MAIFYKHIKGCGSNISNTGTGCWSWIQWSNSINTAPEIYVNTTNDFDGATSLGKIITSEQSNQYFSSSVKFNGGIKTNTITPTASAARVTKISIGNNDIQFYTDNTSKLQITDTLISINFPLNAHARVNFTNNLTVGTEGGNNTGIIKAHNKCEALYFNAISDRRAKENITPASFSALSTVNSLPIYTFNYKTKPEELTIGLIAQEAAEHNLDNFHMVDNLTATGENNDFMQMKESKLVYVLWKAVQELSAEVESLKQQLASK